MNVAVCIKQVPHPDYLSKIAFDPATGRMRREGVPLAINPVDRNAIEAGLRLRERFGGRVTLVSMGPPEAREALEEGLAMGADGAILLCAPLFAGADTLATAFALSKAIKTLGACDVVLCGNETVDSGTGQVGPQLAEFLDMPHVTNVRAMQYAEEGRFVVERALEAGHMKVRVSLPAVFTVTRELNEPRIPSVVDIMQVAGRPFEVYGAAELGIPAEQAGLSGSPTRTAHLFEARRGRGGLVLRGKADQSVGEAMARLRQLRVR